MGYKGNFLLLPPSPLGKGGWGGWGTLSFGLCPPHPPNPPSQREGGVYGAGAGGVGGLKLGAVPHPPTPILPASREEWGGRFFIPKGGGGLNRIRSGRVGFKRGGGGYAHVFLFVIVGAAAPVAQLDRVPDYGSGGRRFESFRARISGMYFSRVF